MRESARNDGEVMRLGRLKRRARPRKMLLLIDVSGSMKARSEDNLRLAHTLLQAAPNVEVFTFGTRLTQGDARAAAETPRAGARGRRASGERLGRRHPHR